MPSKNAILVKMLDRLFAGLVSGPNLNCRPHASRQRIDWMQFTRLQDTSPGEALRQLLSDGQSAKLQARVAAPKNVGKPFSGKKRTGTTTTKASTDDPDPRNSESPDEAVSPDDQRTRDNWTAQQALLTKLRGLAEDAREYEQDTGVHVLHVGFPLLSVPPGAAGSVKSAAGATKRLLAPIAFIPVSLELRAGLNPVVAIEGLHDGADFLIPNEALFAWLERQTGQPILPDPAAVASPLNQTQVSSDSDSESGSDNQTRPTTSVETSNSSATSSATNNSATNSDDPWEELKDLIRRVSVALDLPPCQFSPETMTELRSAPRPDEDDAKAEIVPAAVLGLFPMNNQGLLRDMQAMVAQTASLTGPVQNFISRDTLLDVTPDDVATLSQATPIDLETGPIHRTIDQERLVTMADPCQARAVRLARECQGLVIHGPPGTGKSQTITNIIGDHLSRGERVLLVCDKRTALDVVARRLEHLGLGSLCALIHDPQHDQRNLYMQVREQLEQLASSSIGNRSEAQLKALDKQLQKSHDTLSKAWSLTMVPDPERHVSFHERMGQWLEATLPTLTTKPKESESSVPAKSKSTSSRKARRSKTAPVDHPPETERARVDLLEAHLSEVRDVISRAMQIGFANHPWQSCVGMPLSTFLAHPAASLREDLAAIVEAATDLDLTFDQALPAFALPDDLERIETATPAASPTSFSEQQSARQRLAQSLKQCLADVDPAWRQHGASSSIEAIDRIHQRLHDEASWRDTICSEPLDAKLRITFLAENHSFGETVWQLGTLEAYSKSCDAWYAWIHFGINRRTNTLLQGYGLPPGKESARRLSSFLSGMLTRVTAGGILDELIPHIGMAPTETRSPAERNTHEVAWSRPDDVLIGNWDRLELLIRVLHESAHHPALIGLRDELLRSLTEGDQSFVTALESAGARATALEELRHEVVSSRLFRKEWLTQSFQRLCRGESVTSELSELTDHLETLGEVLRIQSSLLELPTALRIVTEQAIRDCRDADAAMSFIRHRVLSDDIDLWLKSNPPLQALDGAQLTNLHREIHRLQNEKQPCVRDLIMDLWTRRQRERLLAGTGSRLGSLGADLRRRLTTRGERAMRLRQVVAVGQKIEGGDPLFDLRPVWMASPETVAQIFPREELFDIVIFDEASQCRLEEALPVLTRARRVVVAGDPKQLPPTRFFESAVITSDNADVETDQDLFKAHQSEVEDLLTAALSLDIQESHLDVHYRSRNADLVEFSNQQFYSSRLQAIPGHPRNRIRFAPITLYPTAGTYEERTNKAEAAQVVKIVADLLRRAEPPSVGIACFNLTQRDLILDELAALATEDQDFAERLATARNRVGSGAFEGLFVKNLENVQGDERDHMIISTTYGPDKQGRFFRRFGPLGQTGGGRRLNVLITRARDEVHLVTSIPSELYRNLPPIPAGQHPGGGWLLFAYLAYAERLAHDYDQWRENDGDEPSSVAARPVEKPSRTPSLFATQLARLVAARLGIGSDVHWGNDGFCVDVAFHHPRYPEDRTLGVLCDGTRFQYADDPVAWDVFRTAILEEQGWQLSRCWTPEFFRDPEGFLQRFATETTRIADTDPDPQGIPVV